MLFLKFIPIAPPTPPPITDNSVKITLRPSIAKPPLTAIIMKIRIMAYTPPAAMPHSQPFFSARREASKPATMTDSTHVSITIIGTALSCRLV